MRSDCSKPPGGLGGHAVPQFVTITWDDAVTPVSYDIVQRIVGGYKQRNDCGVPSTFFITALGGAEPCLCTGGPLPLARSVTQLAAWSAQH